MMACDRYTIRRILVSPKRTARPVVEAHTFVLFSRQNEHAIPVFRRAGTLVHRLTL